MSEAAYEPSPEAIRLACRQFQASWTEAEERQHRQTYGNWQAPEGWTPQTIATPRNARGELME